MERMKHNVREVHARGGKVLSEVIRMNMVPWVQAEHPEWQDMPQPGGAPLKPEELAKTHVLGCWNSPYGDFFIRSQVAMLKTFDFEAPLAVQAAFYTQNSGKRQIVHLLNELNSSANRALPENNPSMRMEVIPIHDIKITANGARPGKAFLVPGNEPLVITQTAKGAEMTVPTIRTHAMVVIE